MDQEVHTGMLDNDMHHDQPTEGDRHPNGPGTADSDIDMKLDLIDTGIIPGNAVNEPALQITPDANV